MHLIPDYNVLNGEEVYLMLCSIWKSGHCVNSHESYFYWPSVGVVYLTWKPLQWNITEVKKSKTSIATLGTGTTLFPQCTGPTDPTKQWIKILLRDKNSITNVQTDVRQQRAHYWLLSYILYVFGSWRLWIRFCLSGNTTAADEILRNLTALWMLNTGITHLLFLL